MFLSIYYRESIISGLKLIGWTKMYSIKAPFASIPHKKYNLNQFKKIYKKKYLDP